VSKFGSINPDNGGRGLDAVNAVVTVLDPESGLPVALMEGTSVTEIRTAAASAVAAKILAPDATRLTVVGTGVQGCAHVRALTRTHALTHVWLWGIDAGKAAAAAASLSDELGIPVDVPDDVAHAVGSADLVALCTTSARPVIEDAWVRDGATVISVGSFAPDRHEVPPDFVRRATTVVVDHLDSALTDAGPVIEAVGAGSIAAGDILQIGDLVVADRPLRREPADIVYYNSIGLGAQDASAAAMIYQAAVALHAGRVLDLG
jgi:ornithine cyclodeaminase